MRRNEKFVITINRELGSGGRTVGRKLAEKLGVPFYDKAVINALEEKFNLDVDEIEKLKGRSHTWWAELKHMLWIDESIDVACYEPESESALTLETPTSAKMFKTEEEILRGIADEESCVIAGRAGFYVFRNHPNHLNILIQASMPFRLERVMRKQNLSEAEARKTIEKVDKMRENYVKEYTKTSRYDTRNYDLVISADGMSEDEIADMILGYIK